MTLVVHDAAAFRDACEAARSTGHRVGFVPTMGALHEGHLSLVRAARERASFLVASIFVNPTQFGPNEDFQRYPRDLDGDVAMLRSVGVDAVFAPPPAAMYLPGDATRVRVEGLTSTLCGPHRPGHFEGVATVVCKLFGLLGRGVAVFGRKDYQQLQVIRRMTEDLFLPVEVVGLPTLREHDGLAMSSRNRYLGADDRARALALVEGLCAAWSLHARGERSARVLRQAALAPVARAATSIDYVTVADPATLATFDDDTTVTGGPLVAIAARIGATRLIDNCVLGEDPMPRGAP